MTDQTRTPEEIEREIETERSDLQRTIDDLQERLSLDGIMRSVTDGVTDNASDIGRTISTTVQRNPVPIALVGAGLAWLAVSNARGRDDDARYAGEVDYRDQRDYARSGRLGADPYLSRKYGTDKMDEPRGPVHATPEDHGDSPWNETRSRGGALKDRLRGKVGGARGKFGEYRDRARARGVAAGASARSLRDRIADGTHGMSEEGKKRVIAARTRAYEAQVKAEYYARQGRDSAKGLYEQQPLLGGLLAMAAGAAVAAMLPRTQREDEAFGAYRDDLMDEAWHVYEEERARLTDVARATAEDAREQAEGLARTVQDDLKDAAADVQGRAREAANHVADTAKSEAEKKDVGATAQAEAEKAKQKAGGH
ncbi:DUF3618 domain-containing protein [Limimaricola hongkongensis]|uniref:DUF3618 domain-containing protein n=1 Tax=Limimaricola hongkongensis DSM 17492 TaxID=1122180 RepID=A0A017HFR9_9RHOB|nr:DUF3618 domain-containing protein [Limimaricola hongkongensis]EYD73357.1 hypothetical protein Lokhon_00887 [Limimaricola hongkongensis DSM 17492]